MWYALCKWLFECELLSARPSLQTQGWKPLTHKVFSVHQTHRKHIPFQETGPALRISRISLQASFSTARRLAWVAAQTARTRGLAHGQIESAEGQAEEWGEKKNTRPLTVAGVTWRRLELDSNWPQISSAGSESLTNEGNEQSCQWKLHNWRQVNTFLLSISKDLICRGGVRQSWAETWCH